MNSIPIDASITDSSGTTTIYHDLGTLFIALDAANLSFSDISFTITEPDANTLLSQLINIASGGQGNAFPAYTSLSTDVLKQTILDQSRSIIGRMNAVNKTVLAQLSVLSTITDPDKIVKTLILAGQSMIAPDMNILPLFSYNNESDILKSHTDETQLLKYATDTLNIFFPADEWMQNASHARPRLARWDQIRMLSEAAGNPLDISPVQVPFKTNDSWLALEFPNPFTINQDTLSITIHGPICFCFGTAMRIIN